MIILSRKLADPSHIRFAELTPGRALHVRVATATARPNEPRFGHASASGSRLCRSATPSVSEGI